MIGSLLILTGGLVLLAFGAERIVGSSDEIARRIGLSPFLYALTVIALATSLPELVVNSAHAVRGSYSLVVDDVYGSWVFNILFVLGLSATVRPLEIDERTASKIVPGMVVTLIILFPVIADLHISRLEGVFLLAWLVPTAVLLRAKQTQSERASPDLQQAPRRALLKLTNGLVALLAGSGLLVLGIDSLGDSMDLFAESQGRIMGVLVLAISTSLPEVVTVIIGTVRRQGQLVVGTLVGSCAVNLVVGLGGPAVVAANGIPLGPAFLRKDFPVLLLVALLLVPIFHRDRQSHKFVGPLFLLGYLYFLIDELGGWASVVQRFVS